MSENEDNLTVAAVRKILQMPCSVYYWVTVIRGASGEYVRGTKDGVLELLRGEDSKTVTTCSITRYQQNNIKPSLFVD